MEHQKNNWKNWNLEDLRFIYYPKHIISRSYFFSIQQQPYY